MCGNHFCSEISFNDEALLYEEFFECQLEVVAIIELSLHLSRAICVIEGVSHRKLIFFPLISPSNDKVLVEQILQMLDVVEILAAAARVTHACNMEVWLELKAVKF